MAIDSGEPKTGWREKSETYSDGGEFKLTPPEVVAGLSGKLFSNRQLTSRKPRQGWLDRLSALWDGRLALQSGHPRQVKSRSWASRIAIPKLLHSAPQADDIAEPHPVDAVNAFRKR